MNTLTRGVRNAFRNLIRTGSIVIILSISIGLIIAMLAARQAVASKIESVKSSVGNTVSVSPAGVMGFEGGGSALTTSQVIALTKLSHVSSVTSTLADRLTTDDTTSLKSSIDIGALGLRRASENSSSSSSASSGTSTVTQAPAGATDRGNPTTSVEITGVDNTSSASIFGGSTVTWTGGFVFDATKDENQAVVGKALATKNSLKVGSTFTAYGKTLTVVGIYDAGTDFANNGVFTSLSTLQRISSQSGSITKASVTVDSVDNLASVTTAVKNSMGSAADVTNSQETVDQLVAPLESVKTISLFSLIGAIIAGAVIILLTMIMIVRERRREVGVMKAIGASNVGIMKQFIVEAVTLITLALVVGTGIGIAASAPLTNMLVTSSSSTAAQTGPGAGGGAFRGAVGRNLEATVNNIQSSVGIQTLAYGIGSALLIAVLGSAIPSLMISKIKPAEAMRSE
jgi:putative ABC transport system permease protein